MSFKLTKSSPLQGHKTEMVSADGHFRAKEIAFQTFLNLRGEATLLKKPIQLVTNLSLPEEPGQTAYNEMYSLYWLGPTEWLFIVKDPQERFLADYYQNALEQQLTGTFHAITDVTGGNTIFRLEGSRMREILNKGTTLDLRLKHFPPGRCAQTKIGHSAALIDRREEHSCNIIVRRSFAEYLWLFLKEGMNR